MATRTCSGRKSAETSTHASGIPGFSNCIALIVACTAIADEMFRDL
jgi:hypothetical protein